MRTHHVVVASFLLAVAASTPVAAATLHNMETIPQTVSIMENGKTSEMMLAASSSKSEVCVKGCEMTHGTHKLTLKGSETVNIKDGQLVVQN
jgi:hypothetical protein